MIFIPIIPWLIHMTGDEDPVEEPVLILLELNRVMEWKTISFADSKVLD